MDAGRCAIRALCDDVLGHLATCLADATRPVVLVSLCTTSKVFNTHRVLRPLLQVLRERHELVVGLCSRLGLDVAQLRESSHLPLSSRLLAAADLSTLGVILHTGRLLHLEGLHLANNGFSDAGVQQLCAGLVYDSAPQLSLLDLSGNRFGPAGVAALAAALSRGVAPRLLELSIDHSELGHLSASAMSELASPLRRLPRLRALRLSCCDLHDAAFAALLVDELSVADFAQLDVLHVGGNNVSDECLLAFVRLLAPSTTAARVAPRLRKLRECDDPRVEDWVHTLVWSTRPRLGPLPPCVRVEELE